MCAMQKLNPSYKKKNELESIEKEKEREKEREKMERRNQNENSETSASTKKKSASVPAAEPGMLAQGMARVSLRYNKG